MNDRVNELVEWTARKIIVDCGYDSEYPCPYAVPDDVCPHEDKDVCRWQLDQAKQILSHPDLLCRVKCPHCGWSQFQDGESVGMTPCYNCNNTGYVLTPLAEALKEE